MTSTPRLGGFAASIAAFTLLIGTLHAQSTYTADWSSLIGSEGRYSVTMGLSSDTAINGVITYALLIHKQQQRPRLH